MALPGSNFLKKAKSSGVTLENGSLSGAALGDRLGLFAPAWSFREPTPHCTELGGRRRLLKPGDKVLTVAGDETVLWGLRSLRAVLRPSLLRKIPAMSGGI